VVKIKVSFSNKSASPGWIGGKIIYLFGADELGLKAASGKPASCRTVCG
jgi:hypothetical protein